MAAGLLPIDEALSLLLAGVEPLGSERVGIADSGGRILAGPVRALRTQPPFDASAMDGYAVRAEDVAAPPARLAVIGIAPAGRPFAGAVGPGQAVRIFTGAPVPDGADSVLIQENTRTVEPGIVEALEPVRAGANIRRRGLDFSEGEPLLEAGRLVDAAALALAASANHAELEVVRRPLVAVLATGDELLAPGSVVGEGQIISSNTYGVALIARQAGARTLDLGIAPDDRDAIAAAIDRALEAGAEIIVTSGGASVGDHDLVRDVLAAKGGDLDFWKIAMRPGKPLMAGTLAGRRILGLPGNPVASLVCSHVFLKPLVARLAGRAHVDDVRPGVFGGPVAANDLRQDYMRARVVETDGVLVATPSAVQDSSMLRTLAEARALVIREPFAPAAAAGDPCRILMLR
ncbi:gephyrin-like molybdotransferase Glp [Aquibium sp. ELW1220]|uniref:molybdopterin molybdotransferase MoeA n=1 Tax=Aquibium sp. ELW1220 TaxID=2976766 RepID=UPI0025B0EC7F|nr:gephyrin-like molybdotransferase Glp [Aquibium sp. ELW1220]MDN2581565.1 molybdopterin molybdotransferase MoeA [Aquibium sp. ELW1220]